MVLTMQHITSTSIPFLHKVTNEILLLKIDLSLNYEKYDIMTPLTSQSYQIFNFHEDSSSILPYIPRCNRNFFRGQFLHLLEKVLLT